MYEASASLIEKYKHKLRNQTRTIKFQEDIICTTVVPTFESALNYFFTDVGGIEVPLVFSAFRSAAKQAAVRSQKPSQTRKFCDIRLLEHVLQVHSTAPEQWRRHMGVLLELSIVCCARFHDACHIDLPATFALLDYNLNKHERPVEYEKWRQEKDFTTDKGSMMVRMRRRKGQNYESWVCAGDINTPFADRLRTMCDEISTNIGGDGYLGGGCRKLIKTGGGLLKKRSKGTFHWHFSNEVATASGDNGWRANFQNMFKYANVGADDLPEDGGFCGITPHMARRVGASLTNTNYQPSTGRAYKGGTLSARVTTDVGGWAPNSTSLDAVYKHAMFDEHMDGAARRTMTDGMFGGGAPMLGHTMLPPGTNLMPVAKDDLPTCAKCGVGIALETCKKDKRARKTRCSTCHVKWKAEQLQMGKTTSPLRKKAAAAKPKATARARAVTKGARAASITFTTTAEADAKMLEVPTSRCGRIYKPSARGKGGGGWS